MNERVSDRNDSGSTQTREHVSRDKELNHVVSSESHNAPNMKVTNELVPSHIKDRLSDFEAVIGEKTSGVRFAMDKDSKHIIEETRNESDRNLRRSLQKYTSTNIWNESDSSSFEQPTNDGPINHKGIMRCTIESNTAVLIDEFPPSPNIVRDYSDSIDSQSEDIKLPSSLTTHTVREEWLEGQDWSFLDQMDLDLTEDEPEFKKYDLEDYDKVFFKNLNSLRKCKLVLNSQLPRLDHQGKIRAMFKSHGTQMRCISKAVQKCHMWAHRLFNFQRSCMVVCSESSYPLSAGDEACASEISIDISRADVKKTFSFNVDSWSVINSLCLWDFSAFWDGDSDFHAVTELSPYLSLTSNQWKTALEADRPGRWIMMYEPVAVRSLRKQGAAATHRAEKLEEIHNTTRFFKLVLTEYINNNKQYLKNGSVFTGSNLLLALKKDRKKWELFSTMPELEADIKNCQFLLNPKISMGIDMIPYENMNVCIKDKHAKRTIFLCDPIHWTMYMQELLRNRVDAMIWTLTKTAEIKDQDVHNSEIEVQIKSVEILAKEHVSKLRQIVAFLPEYNNLKKYIIETQPKYIDGTEFKANERSRSSARSKSLSENLKPREFHFALRRGHESVRLGKAKAHSLI